jgi:hypothetical protein
MDASKVSEQMVEIEELLVDQQEMLDAMGARAVSATVADDAELERELDELDKDVVAAAAAAASAASSATTTTAATAASTSSSSSASSSTVVASPEKQSAVELDLQRRLENLKVTSTSPTAQRTAAKAALPSN